MKILKNFFSFVLYSLLLYLIYFMLIFPAKGYDYIVGAILVPIILIISLNIVELKELRKITIKHIVWFIAYIPYLTWKIIQANLDVAKRVLNPKMPISPGFIKVKCTSRDDLIKLMLSNSITLTPGTLTIEVKDDYLVVHTIDETEYENREDVKANFVKYLKEIEK